MCECCRFHWPRLAEQVFNNIKVCRVSRKSSLAAFHTLPQITYTAALVKMAIDHTGFQVPEDKFQACLAIYLAALKPLGYEIVHQFGPHVVGLGSTKDAVNGQTPSDFWVIGAKEATASRLHIAFKAESEFLFEKKRMSPR
jgi:hypothetical protein